MEIELVFEHFLRGLQLIDFLLTKHCVALLCGQFFSNHLSDAILFTNELFVALALGFELLDNLLLVAIHFRVFLPFSFDLLANLFLLALV